MSVNLGENKGEDRAGVSLIQDTSTVLSDHFLCFMLLPTVQVISCQFPFRMGESEEDSEKELGGSV